MGTVTNSETARIRTLEGFRPEIELLVRCALPPSMRRDHDRVRTLLDAELSWDDVLEIGGKHGVLPLLSRSIEAVPEHHVPEEHIERLEDHTRSVAVRNLRYTDELHGIFDAFESDGIRAMLFKGPVLASFSYGDLSMREFSDLDVLVHRDDVPAAVDLLEDRGYEWVRDAPRLDDSPLLGGPITMPLVCEYELERGDHMVEIRWRVGQSDRPFGIRFETMWERRDVVPVAGVDPPALDPDDRILMLAYHGTKHRWHLLKWISDFAISIERTTLDWSRVVRRARAHGIEPRLLVGIALSTTLLGIEVPDHVERRIREDGRAGELAASVAAEIGLDIPTRPSSRSRLVYNAKAADSTIEVSRMLLQRPRLHPSMFEYKHVPLPGELHPLYYPVVPVRLTAERLLNLFR